MITLQEFVFPDRAICTEQEMYYRAQGPVGFSETEERCTLGPGAYLGFNTYFNLFNVEKWYKTCQLDNLIAEISGQGQIELSVMYAQPHRSWERIYCEVVSLVQGAPHQIDLGDRINGTSQGVLYLEIKSLGEPVVISGGRFATANRPETLPRLAISITTFKREEQIRDTVARLEEFLKTFEFGDQVHVQVVDNGHSANIPASTYVTPILNPNYGGAGGFARGLLEAEKAGFTHCLFMDDDAAFHMENIARAYTFLALAKDPRTAVAGAMINNTHKWAMWENGAVFDGGCQPLFCGTDLRNPDAIINMEFEAARPHPANFYGGWWFFAFAINRVKHYPFPFFVRGDDISFSLMNDFNIHTLSGVVSFQDDFTAKESPQTLYLDLRNHLIHHLIGDKLSRSALGTAKIALRFIMRSLLRFHYESAEAQLQAWQDVMQGPEFFDRNIDMAERRASIKANTTIETWLPIDPLDLTEKQKKTLKPPAARHRLGIWTLNGHLVPFSGQRWDRIVLGIGDRGLVAPAFGASRITYLNTSRDQGYTVEQSKRRFFGIAWQMLKTLRRFRQEHDRLKADYRRGYDTRTGRSYWEKQTA